MRKAVREAVVFGRLNDGHLPANVVEKLACLGQRDGIMLVVKQEIEQSELELPQHG